MPCSNCGAQFGIFKRKKQCQQCRFYFCNLCLKLQRNKILCAKCHILTTRPLSRSHLMQLKPRDLVLYLKSIRVSTSGCVEKEDLVNLLLANVSNAADSEHIESRRDQETTADSSDSNPFRPPNFQNIQNIWATVQEQYENFRFRPASATYAGSTQPPRRTYTRERPPYYQPPPSPLDTQNTTEGNAEPGAAGTSRIPETHDCIEIEDIGDWEFVSRTGDPLSDADPAIIEEVIHIHQEIYPPPRRANSETSIPVSVNREPGSSQPISEAEMHQSMHNLSSDSNLTLHMSDNSESMRNIMETIEAVSESEVDLNNDEVMSASSSKLRKYLKLSDIRSEEALVDLNVRQLKELLIVNRVDYKGCVEKNELLQRVTRLWQDNAQLRENLEKLSADDLCKICMDAPVECVMLECGHLATCTACGKQLNECPICRQYVVRVVRTFRA